MSLLARKAKLIWHSVEVYEKAGLTYHSPFILESSAEGSP